MEYLAFLLNFIKAIASAVPYLIAKVTRKSIKIERAPKNLLQIASVNGSLDKLNYHFGPPSKVGVFNAGIRRKMRFFEEYACQLGLTEELGADAIVLNEANVQYCWEFADLLLLIISHDQKCIDQVNVLLIGNNKASTFKIYPYPTMKPILGKTTLEKIAEECDGEIVVDYSSKHYAEYIVHRPTTINGDHYFLYGYNEIYSHHSPKSRKIKFLEFLELAMNKLRLQKLKEFIEQYKEKEHKKRGVNWLMISDSRIETPYFDWWHFV